MNKRQAGPVGKGWGWQEDKDIRWVEFSASFWCFFDVTRDVTRDVARDVDVGMFVSS